MGLRNLSTLSRSVHVVQELILEELGAEELVHRMLSRYLGLRNLSTGSRSLSTRSRSFSSRCFGLRNL